MSRATHSPLSLYPQPPAPSLVQMLGSRQPDPQPPPHTPTSLYTSSSAPSYALGPHPSRCLPPSHRCPPPGPLGQGLLGPALCSALESWWDLGSTGLRFGHCWGAPLGGTVHHRVSGPGAENSPEGRPAAGTGLSRHSQTTHWTLPPQCTLLHPRMGSPDQSQEACITVGLGSRSPKLPPSMSGGQSLGLAELSHGPLCSWTCWLYALKAGEGRRPASVGWGCSQGHPGPCEMHTCPFGAQAMFPAGTQATPHL